MAITVRPLTPPTIIVNGVSVGAKEVKNGEKSFTGNRDVASDSARVVSAPATVTFSGPAGAEIRYTFNSKKVSLGSKRYRASNPPVIRAGGDGFGNVLTIRAKAYKNGLASATTEVVVHILNNNAVGRQADALVGDTRQVSQTGK